MCLWPPLGPKPKSSLAEVAQHPYVSSYQGCRYYSTQHTMGHNFALTCLDSAIFHTARLPSPCTLKEQGVFPNWITLIVNAHHFNYNLLKTYYAHYTFLKPSWELLIHPSDKKVRENRCGKAKLCAPVPASTVLPEASLKLFPTSHRHWWMSREWPRREAFLHFPKQETLWSDL